MAYYDQHWTLCASRTADRDGTAEEPGDRASPTGSGPRTLRGPEPLRDCPALYSLSRCSKSSITRRGVTNDRLNHACCLGAFSAIIASPDAKGSNGCVIAHS